ncbi:MAG: pirin family protein [Candidatus Nanopelagicales bacterium]|nr:pirin family protein [Candidatus Nanopelagicales bacterium]
MPIEVHDGVTAEVGRIQVRRVLPRRRLRTVGAWCFADHMGPAEVTEEAGLDVGPHPHTGLQTVTWLMDGAVLHRDSLGSEQLIRPGQVNLMTAGRGVVHSEEHTGDYRGTLQGVQLWVAQPEADRHGDPAFDHHAELPLVTWDSAEATLIAGHYLGTRSPAGFATDLLGMQVLVQPGVTRFPLRADFEHAVIALDAPLLVGAPGRDRSVAEPRTATRPGQIAALGTGHAELEVEARGRVRLMLLGGLPFPEPVFMWWNFVARTADEVSCFYADWRDRGERFGVVPSPLDRIPAPVPPWEPIRSTQPR